MLSGVEPLGRRQMVSQRTAGLSCLQVPGSGRLNPGEGCQRKGAARCAEVGGGGGEGGYFGDLRLR